MVNTSSCHGLCLLGIFLLAAYEVQSTELQDARHASTAEKHKSPNTKALPSILIGSKSKKEGDTPKGDTPSKYVDFLQVSGYNQLISAYINAKSEGTWESEAGPTLMNASEQTHLSGFFHLDHVEKRDASSSTPSQESRITTCLREQSKKSAKLPIDLPAHVSFHLSNDGLDEATHLSNFSFPPSCVEALCHPGINVSFRVVRNISANSAWTFMAMYGRAVHLLDQCRAHLQNQSYLQRTVDHEGNALYQIGNYYKLIIFQNQDCHHAPSLNKISALTTLQVLGTSPPLCLQNLLCSPTTFLKLLKRNPNYWVWIPVVQGPPPVDHVESCFHHFQDSQTQTSSVVYVSICRGQKQHDLVLLANPHCYVNRQSRYFLDFAVAFNDIPPPGCLSLLCDQQFRYGYHKGDLFYIMAYGQDVSVMAKCRFELSSYSKKNRTYGIKGFTFPLNPVQTFFLPDRDCYAFTSEIFTPVFVSIAIHNVTLPEPCLPLLCRSDSLVTLIANRYYYGSLLNNQTACFDALSPNPKTNDVMRVLPVTPKLSFVQIAPRCTRVSESDVNTFDMYAFTLDPSVLFPVSCYSRLCYGKARSISEREGKLKMYFIDGYNQEETGCYSSFLTLNSDTRITTDSKNCSYTLVHLPTRLLNTNITNVLAISDPKCQIHGYQFADMFVSNFIHGVSSVQNVFFDCVARKIQDFYGYFSMFFSPLLVMYGKGVQQQIPSSCIYLACSSEMLISYQFYMRNDGRRHAYIMFHSLIPKGVKDLSHCNEALIASTGSEDSTPLSRGTLIPSNVDLSGYEHIPPNELFLVFPPAQCFVVQNVLQASVISFYLTLHKGFSWECVQRLICNSDVEVIEGSVLYITYGGADEDIDKCFDRFEDREESNYLQNPYVKVIRKDNLYFSFSYSYTIFDLKIKPVGARGKMLVSELILTKRDLEHLASCMKCIPRSSVASQKVMEKNKYLMVPYYNESEYCQRCRYGGTRVGNSSDLVSVLNDENLTLFMMHRNATLAGESLYDSYRITKRYLYFIVHHLEICARLDQGIFRTLVFSNGNNIKDIYVIQNEELSCIEQVRKSSQFSCFQGPMHTICREYEGHAAILYLPNCYSPSTDKLEILSNLILSSTENATTISKYIIDFCKSDTHVVSYVLSDDEFYFEIIGRSSSLNRTLAVLQPRWRLRPADYCMILLSIRPFMCPEASSSTKVEDLVQSQIGIDAGRNDHFEFVFQCITFVHSGAVLWLYRIIYINPLVDMGEKHLCRNNFKANGEKVMGLFRNDSFYIRNGNFYPKSQDVLLDRMFKLIPTGSCPSLKNDITLASATASVVQNNTVCLQDLCNRNFLLPNKSENQFSFLGPLPNSLYRSSCFKSIPPQVWANVNEAFRTGRVTINKFWPGCFYDFIILSNNKDAKIDDWYYLSNSCKAREIIYLFCGVILTTITILGNIVIIYTLFYQNRMNDPPCRLRINLAFADLLVGVFVECQALRNHLGLMTGELTLHQLDQLGIYEDFQKILERFPFGFNQIRFLRTGYAAFCGFAFSVSSFVSLTFMALMSLERFLKVAYQRHHGMLFRQSRLTYIILATWFGGILFSILLLQKEEGHDFVGYFDPLSKITTSLPSSNIQSASFITFYAVIVFFTLTSLSVVIVSVLTFWKFSISHLELRKHKIYADNEMKEVLIKKLRVVLTVFVGAYLLSCVPLVVVSALNIDDISPALHHIVWWIYLSSSAWNCYLYNFRLPKFRKDVHDAFICIIEPMKHSWLAVAYHLRELIQSLYKLPSSNDSTAKGSIDNHQMTTLT